MEDKNSQKARAVLAGERAVRTLDRSLESLKGAGRYGMWEIFGGGFLSGARKSPQTVEAKNAVKKARDAMAEFKELLDERWVSGQQWIDMCEFIRFADHFLEQPIADWRARSRIDDAKIQVSIARNRLESLLRAL